MQLTKNMRAENAAIRPEMWELNKDENRARKHRVPLANAFLAALPSSNGRWIRRISDSAKRCRVQA